MTIIKKRFKVATGFFKEYGTKIHGLEKSIGGIRIDSEDSVRVDDTFIDIQSESLDGIIEFAYDLGYFTAKYEEGK